MGIRLRAILALILIFSPCAAFADKRVALLIGNSSYSAVAKLVNPPNDVAAMKQAFEAAGFDKVTPAVDLGHDDFIKALRSFEDDAQDSDVAVVYYSGHGLEMNGENYLIPVDAQLHADRDVEDEAISLERVLHAVSGARRLKLVILDACRNNPFSASMKRSAGTRSLDRGLGRVEPEGSDTLVAFAAKAGTVALDGDGQNSPFAVGLAKHLFEPGVDIRLALGRVRDEVLGATRRQQEPFTYGSLGGDAVALSKVDPGPEAPKPAADVPTPPVAERRDACADAATHWQQAQKFDRIDLYQRHLALFGQCAFADFAKARIEELQRAAAAPPPPPPDAARLALATADFTGTWSNGTAPIRIKQNGDSISFRYLAGQFDHRFVGRIVAPGEVEGQYSPRLNRATGCRTSLEVHLKMDSPRTFTLTWRALDSNCDLKAGQTGQDPGFTKFD